MIRVPSLFAPLVLSLFLPSAALAQAGPSNDDLRALRYYTQNNETAAVEAEIQRLKTVYPGWTPPENLNALPDANPDSEVAEIYARLARGDIPGAKTQLERTRARFPDWRTPPQLTNQIAMAEGQIAFDRAVDGRDTAAAVRIGSRMPALFRCDRINNAWNLAELQASSGNSRSALSAYSQIVNTCTSVPELVATIEKAEPVTSDAELKGLTDTAANRFPANAATFEQLNQRLMAGRGRGTARATPAAKPKANTRTTTRRTTATAPTRAQPVAPTQRTASVPSYGDPNLSALPRSGDNRIGRTRAAKNAGNFRACIAESARPRSLDLAYERAWCAYNLDRSLEALAYFSAAAGGNLGGSIPRDARFGMTLSLLKRNMVDDAAQIAATTNLTDQQRKEVETIILDQRGVNAFQAKEYSDSIAYFDALEEMDGGLRRDLAMLRGYAYLGMGDKRAALDQFQQMHNVLATAETRQALTRASQ